MKGDPAMRRLTATPVLLVLLCLCIAAIVVLGTQLVGAQPGTRTAAPPHPRATVAKVKAAPSDSCVIRHAVPRYVQSVLLTVANDPLSVRSGHTICVAAYTLPRTKVTMNVFGTT